MHRRVWRIDRAGSLDRLRLCDESISAPSAGEVTLRVHAVGLNFADAFACQGLYSATPTGPFVPGLECAGVVEAVGSAVAAWRIGDRAIALTRFGGYASALNVDARYLLRVPPGWSLEHAAAWPVQALTASYGLVRRASVQRGDVVLVQSAAGGVGLQALAILERIGAVAIAVVGSESKHEFLRTARSLDVPRIVVRRRADYVAQLDAALAAAGSARGSRLRDATCWTALPTSRRRPQGPTGSRSAGAGCVDRGSTRWR